MILFKQHNSQQIAHLYEHLFAMATDDLFFREYLFPSLDYHVSASTLPKGMIYVKVEFLTDEAKALMSQVPKLDIALDDKSLNLGLFQILAEKEQKLATPGGGNSFALEPIRQELKELDKKPWQNIDRIDVIDPQDFQMSAGSLYLPQKQEAFPARKVSVTVTLDRKFADSHKDSLPLFWELTALISETSMANLYATAGFYSQGITHSPKHQATKVTHAFRAPQVHPLELPDVLAEVEDTILDLHKASAFRRLASELSKVSNAERSYTFPSPRYLFERTNVIIGSQGWQRITTDENCNRILSHMRVTVSSGRSRVSSKITSLLNIEK